MAGALSTAAEHKKALEQAEKMEQEFVALMTGQRTGDGAGGPVHVMENEKVEAEVTVS